MCKLNDVADSFLFAVHPPNILQNRRDFLFFQVMRNNFYEIAFTKKTTYLMRPPYKTMCIEYLEDSEFRKYITRDSCITYCILDQVSSAFCANYYGVLIEEMFTNKLNNYTMKQICAHDNQVCEVLLVRLSVITYHPNVVFLELQLVSRGTKQM